MTRLLGAVLSAVLAVAVVTLVSVDARTASSQVARRRARRPRVSAAERRAIRNRHVAAPAAETRRWAAMTPPPLVLRVAGAATPFRMTPIDEAAGTFDEAALAMVQQALACRDGTTHPIHPRLVSLVYETVRHFRVPWVNVVSGYRSGNPSSRHGQGRAIDFALPGVGDTRLATWLRQRGFVGVGIYPTSGFVHLDVRARSYFWRDLSAPSERSRERQMLPALGARYDRAARARGVEPVPDVSASEAESEAESETETESGDEGTVEIVAEVADAGVP